ncbi:hypothetical protein HK102_006714 [Quaeritorhiza haematococci]|nr:hypothetical protein HK102_006714 [Quaeritorhiza haematococci]
MKTTALLAAPIAVLIAYFSSGEARPSPRGQSGSAAPVNGISRSPCPALNAMANKGILPYDGRNITRPQIVQALEETFNTKRDLTDFAADIAFGDKAVSKKDPRINSEPYIDLHFLNEHNKVEFDVSFTRRDNYHGPDNQNLAVDVERVNRVVRDYDQNGFITADNWRKLRRDLKAEASNKDLRSPSYNPEFSYPGIGQIAHYFNMALLLNVFGDGSKTPTADVKELFLEEKIPKNFQKRPENKPVSLGETIATAGWLRTLNGFAG